MIGLRGGISLAIAVILCAALALIGWGAQRAAEHTIVPEILAKAQSVGRSAAALVTRADAAGIPPEKMVGVAAYFEQLRAANAEFAQISFFAPGGVELARAGAASDLKGAPAVDTPVIGSGGAVIGTIAITVDPSVVSEQVGAVLIDVAFIGIVSLLVALELVALVIGSGGIEALVAVEQRLKALARGRLSLHESGPGGGEQRILDPIDVQMALVAARHEAVRSDALRRGDAAAVARLDELAARTGLGQLQMRESQAAVAVRPALFLFMLAEELTRPFLPHFAQQLAAADGGVRADMAASLPIVVFMAVVALCQIPFAGLSERMGRRGGFLLGALLAATGYALSAASTHYPIFIAARVATAVGYALVFVSAQGHVVDHAQGAARTGALAVFVRAIMVASLCGPPIGGVIADRVGAGAAFGVSAGLALAAIALAAVTLPRGVKVPVHAAMSWRDLFAATRLPRLMPLLLGCAFPAKFLLAALCFLLVPLELQHQGYSAAAVGRFQMIYPIVMVLAVPFFAALADRFDARAAFVVAGGLVAGVGALAVPLYPSVGMIAFALLMLGIGQAMSIASQSALVADTAPAGRSAGVLGLFRLVERSGNAAGPASAGFLMAAMGFSAAVGLVGAGVVAGVVVFALTGDRLTSRAGRQAQRAHARATAAEGDSV